MAIVSHRLLTLKPWLKPELLAAMLDVRCFSLLVKVSGLLQSILKPRLFTFECRMCDISMLTR